MIIENIRFVANTNKSKLIAKQLEIAGIKSLERFNKQDSEVKIIVVVGGDGELIQAINQFHHYGAAFYGINAGNLGFLMNEFSEKNLLDDIISASIVQAPSLQLDVEERKGEKKTYFAFNEVTIFRKTMQAAKLEVIIDEFSYMKNYLGDGLLISTIIGSAAYNYGVGGYPMPITSNLLPITPIAPFRPRRWRGAMVPNNSSIQVIVHNFKQRPCFCTADLEQSEDIVHAVVKQNKNRTVDLLFNKRSNLAHRLMQEQFQ